jgi:uncharacterized protein (DUF924 family)
MEEHRNWQRVYDFWFPGGLDKADLKTHGEMAQWWMRGGANAELPPFTPLVEAAISGALDDWATNPQGRLSLIIVLDQFPRGLFAGTPKAYGSDPDALRLAEEGLENGQYDALAHPWEKFFFTLPFEHTEGPDHLQRLDRVVALAEQRVVDAPSHLRQLYEFAVSQSRANRETISRFGRYPHRNAVLGRTTMPEEVEYLEKGDFVYKRPIPDAG